jgi:small-conductance mechanosensitive channel
MLLLQDEPLLQSILLRNLIVSVAWALFVLLARALTLRMLSGKEEAHEEARLRWRQRTIQVALLLLIGGLFFIWVTELKTMAFSAVAIAAALVIATKELILCFLGSLLRTVSNSYDVGDRIELAGHRGDVIDYGLFSTTILEVGPVHRRTGRAITIPNSVLLSQSVINESFTDEYVLHSFELPLRESDDWQDAERFLLATARRVCEGEREPAEKNMRRVARAHGLAPSTVEPRVSLRVSDPERVTLLVRVPTAARNKGRTEQTIVRAFLEWRGKPRTDGPA